jgi:hypothetical protein
MQVVSIHSAAVVFSRHFGCVLPGKHVEGTLLRICVGIQAAEVKAVEAAVDEGGRQAFLCILRGFCCKFSGDDLKGRAELCVLVNFNRVDFFSCIGGYQAKAVAVVARKADALNAVFGQLFPFELSKDAPGLSANDKQVFSRGLDAILLATNDIAVARRVFEGHNVKLNQQKAFLFVG